VGVSGSYFQTFCVEHDEFVTPGTTYNFNVSTAADNGGVNTNSGDPLGCRTAYLYTQFWNGTLSDYDYELGSGRAASATALQQAIWYLENEVSYSSLNSQARAWVDEATDAVSAGGSWYDQYGTGIGNVRVMNMYTASADPGPAHHGPAAARRVRGAGDARVPRRGLRAPPPRGTPVRRVDLSDSRPAAPARASAPGRRRLQRTASRVR
jgi:hypothetical protein